MHPSSHARESALKAATWVVTAVGPVAVALVLTLSVQRFFSYPFLFLFLGAVVVSAWQGGMAAGAVSGLLAFICVTYFLFPPFNSFVVTAPAEVAAFAVCALVASWGSAAKKRTVLALQHARDQLETRVSERTAEIEASNAELREREHRLRLLTEVIPQQIWSGAPDGQIDYCNQQLLDYVGLSLESVRGGGFVTTLHPEDRERFRRMWSLALETATSFEGEFRVRAKDGAYRLFFVRGVPFSEPGGKVVRWYGTNTDVEEHRRAEETLIKARADLAHLSRVLTMGELTTSIAHEISQPLTAVVAHGHACLGWLSGERPNLDKAQHSVERIIQDGTRAGAVLRRIQALFRKEAPATQLIDLNEGIYELTDFVRDEANRRHISLRTNLDPQLPRVRGDRVQLQQVVLNLVMNAMDAMEGLPIAPKDLLITSRRDDGGGVAILVEDSGVGIRPESVERIFDPFYTTKMNGTGMGLSISRSIVESHQGRLYVRARPGGGSTFQFTLPASDESGDA